MPRTFPRASSILRNQVNRLVISLCGLLFGLLVTWVFIYTFSHLYWVVPNHIATDCHELGKCATPWWVAPVLISYSFGPAIAFCALNAVAWRRWPVRKWALWGVAILAVTATLYLADYFAK